MPNLLKIGLLVALVIIGPLMFTVSRQNSLNAGFAKVQVGDSLETLRTVMGPPQLEARENLLLKGDVEYRYTVWPLSTLWVVALKDGQVIDKAQTRTP